MLNIDEPVTNTRRSAFLDLAFRPFFLLGALLSCIVLPLWLLHWYQLGPDPLPQAFWADFVPLWWHPHEMLFGFAMAIVVGFLMTASQTWTGRRSLKGGSLLVVVLCWGLARALLLLPNMAPLWLPALLDCLFLLICAGKLAAMIWAVRQKRNAAFPLLLLLAALLNGLSYWALYQRDLTLAYQVWLGTIWWMALMITVISGRVVPFFTAVRLKLTKPEPLPYLEWPLLGLMLVVALGAFSGKISDDLMQPLLGITALLHLLRLSRWNGLKTLKEPMLWSLHLSYLSIPVALLLMAVYFDNPYAQRQLLHLLAIGAIGGMTLSMIARISLGHTGRNIYKGPKMAPAFALIALAAVCRGLAPCLWPSQTPLWHWLALICWCLAFGYFVLRYLRILVEPRIDGRPG